MRVNTMDYRSISAKSFLVWLFLFCLVAAAPATVSAAALPVDAYLEIEGGSIIGGRMQLVEAGLSLKIMAVSAWGQRTQLHCAGRSQ